MILLNKKNGTAFAYLSASNKQRDVKTMYQEHPIDLIWDESSPMDANVSGILTRAGFRPRSMGATEVARYVKSNGFGPCVLCMHRRELPDIEMIVLHTGRRPFRLHRGAGWVRSLRSVLDSAPDP